MNGNFIDYIIVYGSEKYHPQNYYSARKKYDTISEARNSSGYRRYANAYIVKFQHARDSGDILYYKVLLK